MKRILTQPLPWAAACLTASILLLRKPASFGFFGFVLSLVAGWLIGQAVLGVLDRVSPAWKQALVLTVIVGAGWGTMYLFMSRDALLGGTAAMGGAFLALWMAGLVAIGWMTLGLPSYLIGLIPRSKRAELTQVGSLPEWRAAPETGTILEFDAVPMRFGTLVLLILVTIMLGGAIVVALMIAVPLPFPPKLRIVMFGILAAFPLYFALSSLLRARTEHCSVQLLDQGVRLVVGGRPGEWRYAELESLIWRRSTDYARIELGAPGARLSLLVGQAKPSEGVRPELPRLPQRARDGLERAGLLERPTRHPDLLRYRRKRSAPSR